MSGKILVVCDDLLLWARIRDAAKGLGREAFRIDGNAAMERALAAGPVDRILVDLTVRHMDVWSGIARWKSLDPAPEIVAFGPHVDDLLLARARAQGFDRVVSRSRLHRDLLGFVGPDRSPPA